MFTRQVGRRSIWQNAVRPGLRAAEVLAVDYVDTGTGQTRQRLPVQMAKSLAMKRLLSELAEDGIALDDGSGTVTLGESWLQQARRRHRRGITRPRGQYVGLLRSAAHG
jgi:hypothetical protein